MKPMRSRTFFALFITMLFLSGIPGQVLGGADLEGQVAPVFQTKDVNEQSVDLTEVIGKKVILFDFWSIYCVPCLQEIPKIQELYAKYADKGLQCYSINTDFFKPKKIQDFSKDKLAEVQYPILLDSGRKISNLYKVFTLPVTVIIGLDGKIEFYHMGYQAGDEQKMEKLIVKLLPEGGEL